MALHIRVKTEDDHLIHFDTITGNYTLCGLETGGDNGIGAKVGERTTQKVNCKHCIMIYNFCKTIKSNEIKR